MKLAPLVLILGLVTAGTACSEEVASSPGDAKRAPQYTVDVYDPKRKPTEDLATTVKQATARNRRILLQVGGNWCGWCRTMSRYFHENDTVAAALAENFIIMKVNWSPENPNGFFLKDYPDIESFPHLFVLESDGKLLHSQPTEGFEKRGSYNEEALLEFVRKWAAKSDS